MQIVSCKEAGTDLPSCPKVLGSWLLDGPCIATGPISTCGPGIQNRTILVPAKNGGEECTGNLDRACNERNCPGKRLSKV